MQQRNAAPCPRFGVKGRVFSARRGRRDIRLNAAGLVKMFIVLVDEIRAFLMIEMQAIRVSKPEGPNPISLSGCHV